MRGVGEFAVRGGILDLYAPGWTEALRLDFFGDTLESIRVFDAATQRTTGQRKSMALQAMSEVALTPETISRFRRAYIEAFGAPQRDDGLYAAVSEGRRFAGMEHWLPFFYERLETVFDYLPDAPVVFDHLAHEALAERHTLILDHYEARRQAGRRRAEGRRALQAGAAGPALSLARKPRGVARTARSHRLHRLRRARCRARKKVFHAGSRHGRSFAEERADPNANVFDVVVKHIADERAGTPPRRRRRLDRRLARPARPDPGRTSSRQSRCRWRRLPRSEKLEPGQAALAVLPLESGFETEQLVVVAEQDILGDRLIRRSKRKKRASDFIAEASSLSAGDIVVHADHGIGRFIGLRTIEAVGAPHDCLEIHYAGDDRLFLPVENIELLSRYGSDSAEATLDKLGGGAWQSRKARLKKRLLDMAGQLIRIAAERQMRSAPRHGAGGRPLWRVLRALPL